MLIFLIALLLVLVGAMAWLTLQPGQIRVESHRTIHATSETLFDTVRNFKTWPGWNPWLVYEPDAQVTFADSPASVGGWYAWEGKMIGAGEMTHVSLTPHTAIADQIQFLRPMRSINEVNWRFGPRSEGVDVTWSMYGQLPFFFRWMGSMISRSVRLDYEIGLARLAMYVGDMSDPLTLGFDGKLDDAGFKYVALHYEGALADMPAAMREGYPRLSALVDKHGMQKAGLSVALYHNIDVKKQTVVCDMAIPVSNPQAVDGLLVGELPARQYARTTLTGHYLHLEKAWHAAFSYLRMHKWRFKKGLPMLERYANDPQTTPPAEWKTYLDIPLR